MKKTVVILLSDKRSGSTMFERELCKHPSIHHIGYSPHSYNESHHWLKAAVILGLPAAMFSGARVYRGYGSKKNARAYLVDEIRGNVPGFRVPEDDRSLVFRGWEAMCERFAKPIFFEKSPQHLAHWGALSLMLEWAETTDYDVKFVGLVRNPLGVMYSAQHLFGTDPEERQYGWVAIQRNLLAFRQMVPSGQYYELCYEDLIRCPQVEFAKVCGFIGAEPDDSIGADVNARSLHKAKEDPRFGLQLADCVRRMAKEFGYSDCDLVNPPARKGAITQQARSALRTRLCDRWLKPALLRINQIKKH